MNPLFLATIKNGKIHMTKDRNRFMKYLEKFEGKEVQIKVQKPKSVMSLNQLRYYWGVPIKMLTENLGNLTPTETHMFLGSMFLKVGLEVGGVQYFAVRSITDLSTIEMEDYLEQVRKWAVVERQLVIPLPNEIDWDEVILRTTV